MTTRAASKGFLIKPGISIREAFDRIQLNRSGVAFVVGESDKLLGAITDDQVRVLMLSGDDLSRSVDKVMIKSGVPKIGPDASNKDAAKVMNEAGTAAVAVVERGRVLSVVTAGEAGAAEAAPTAVIMAGGRGQRLRPLTDKVPKPLLKLGSMSIVERIMSNLRDAGVQRFYLSVNYKAQAFERRLGDGSRLGISLEYLREKEKLGTAGALSLLPSRHKGPVLVTNADIITRLDYARMFDFHRRHGGVATMAAIMHSAQIPYGVARNKGDRLLVIEEKPEVKVLCNAGIYILEPEALKLVDKGVALDMPDLLAKVVTSGAKVSVFPVIERWFDIGSPEEFQQVLIEFATYEEE